MKKIFELKLVEKISTKRQKDFFAISEAFSLLHETLVKLRRNNHEANIAFKPFLKKHASNGSLTTISFFSFDKNILEEFKAILEKNKSYIEEFVNYEERTSIINNYFRILDIKEQELDLSNAVIYKRKRIHLDSLSRNKLIPNINIVLDNMGSIYDSKTKKGKIQLLIPLFGIDKSNVKEKYKLIQERLKKEEIEFCLRVNSSSTQKQNILFSFIEQEVLDCEGVNFKVNSYGLSSEENVFLLPKEA